MCTLRVFPEHHFSHGWFGKKSEIKKDEAMPATCGKFSESQTRLMGRVKVSFRNWIQGKSEPPSVTKAVLFTKTPLFCSKELV